MHLCVCERGGGGGVGTGGGYDVLLENILLIVQVSIIINNLVHSREREIGEHARERTQNFITQGLRF